MIDIHTHILPGLDDGARSMDIALHMADIAVKSGTEILLATPHVISGVFDNDKERIVNACNEFNRELENHNLTLQVLPGAEYYLEPDLPERLARKELLTLNNGRYLLLELPGSTIPQYTAELLYNLQIQGTEPIIAHPERNMELMDAPYKLEELVGHGALTQVTAGSLTGLFGGKVKRVAFSFIENGLIHFLASDAHTNNRRTPALDAAARIIEEKYGQEFAVAMVNSNPRALLEDREVSRLPAVKTSWLNKILAKIKSHHATINR